MQNEPNGYRDLTQAVSSKLASLRSGTPEVMKAFNELGRAATAPGALDAKTKELIALALSVAVRCDPCIGFHAKALVKHGGTQAGAGRDAGRGHLHGRRSVADVCRQRGGRLRGVCPGAGAVKPDQVSACSSSACKASRRCSADVPSAQLQGQARDLGLVGRQAVEHRDARTGR